MAGPTYATNYNDGGTHTISGPDTDVVITNGTTVNIVPGASITPALQYDPFGGHAVVVSASSLNVTGGSMTGGSSHVGGDGVAGAGNFDISGGTFQGGDGSSVRAGAGAELGGQISISGGNFYGGAGDTVFGALGGDGLVISSSAPNAASISGGTFTGQPTSNTDGYDLHVTGTATVDITGGNFNYGHSAFANDAIGNISGGNFNWIQSYDNAALHVTNGQFHFFSPYNSSVVQFSGGSSNRFELHDDSIVSMSAGNLMFGASLDGNSTLNVTGGNLVPFDPWFMAGTSVLNVYGTGLMLEFVDPYWLLSGKLQDGTTLLPTTIFRNDNSVINLHEIPEPPSFALALCGVVSLAVARRRLR